MGPHFCFLLALWVVLLLVCWWWGILDWGRGCQLRSTWPFTACQRLTESLSNDTMYPGGRTGIICFLDMSSFSSCLLLYTCIIFYKFLLCLDTLSPSRLDSPWEGALWKFWTQGLPCGQESLFPLQHLSTCPVSCCPHCLWLFVTGLFGLYTVNISRANSMCILTLCKSMAWHAWTCRATLCIHRKLPDWDLKGIWTLESRKCVGSDNLRTLEIWFSCLAVSEHDRRTNTSPSILSLSALLSL